MGIRLLFISTLSLNPAKDPQRSFMYAKPSTLLERQHNKEALAILRVKKAGSIIEQQAIGTCSRLFTTIKVVVYQIWLRIHT